MKNKEMSMLKSIGIILVVMTHGYQIFMWFPPYAFHMALFIFISGYLYKDTWEENISGYLKRKFKKMIIPYFLYNAAYALITYILHKKSVHLGEMPNVYNFFVTPFINGHQYHLFLSGWFLIELFLVQVIFIFLHKGLRKFTENDYIHLVFFFLVGLLGTYFAKIYPKPQGIALPIVRTMFCIFFYYMGMFYRKHLEDKKLFSGRNMVIVFIIQVFCIVQFGIVYYELAWADFYGRIFLPFVVSLNGIYMAVFVAKAMTRLFPEDDFLYVIGENTFPIMCNHLLVFFTLNCIFYKLGKFEFNNLSNIWFTYKPGQLWLLYIIAGTLVPTYVSIGIKKALKKFSKI